MPIKFKKTLASIFGMLLLLVVSQSCGKSGGGDDPPAEQNLVINIDPNPGVSVASSLGATYDFKVLITSVVPAGGVKVDVSCTRDADNASVSSQSLNSNVSPVNVAATNLQPGVLCTVKVTVTSLSKPTNTATTSFKVARK